jgi:hypothetical protein
LVSKTTSSSSNRLIGRKFAFNDSTGVARSVLGPGRKVGSGQAGAPANLSQVRDRDLAVLSICDYVIV